MNKQPDFFHERQNMVATQLAARRIDNAAVLDAMAVVPREKFVPDEFQSQAYKDAPLPIPAGQTISQPYVVGIMIAALDCQPDDIVLEIGTGSGYAAAVLSRIVRRVITLERHEKLAVYARQRLAQLGYDNIEVHMADGSLGWPDAAPYHSIMVSAAGPYIPPTLKAQLAINGRLVMPVGRRKGQNLMLLQRIDETTFKKKNLGPVKFVPLVGEAGWERH